MTDRKTPIDPITHPDMRANIPTPELAPMMDPDDARPIKAAYALRNPDLDPQIIWRGKDIDQAAVTADAPPIYLQEQVHPKAIIEDLRRGNQRNGEGGGADLFDHFGVTDEDREAEVEFYRHSTRWSNRMILGDGLQVMASLAEREGLKGQVQAIYIDPPYGIKFNSNFQWSTTSRDVKDGKLDHLTREPEQVKAFRDTWRDGIHSYLQYLRDRLVVARELLTESGSCFVQIGDENVHRVRALMDEVFGEENFVSQISVRKTTSEGSSLIGSTADFIVWYAKTAKLAKYRPVLQLRSDNAESRYSAEYADGRSYRTDNLTSSRSAGSGDVREVWVNGQRFTPGNGTFKTTLTGLKKLRMADRLDISRGGKLNYRRFADDYGYAPTANLWTDISGAVQSRSDPKVYVVQTSTTIIARCLLMTTDPGDLVLDPTCGSGTTAYVAEQWGRRWITIDTSRVALALARARIMGAKYPWYILADSPEGQRKEAEVTRASPATHPTYNDIRHGFVYNRVPHITLKSIANNTEIDTIWDACQPAVEQALRDINYNMDTFPCRHPVETGGRKGEFVDFIHRPEVTLPSGEEIDGGDFMEWEVPRKATTPMEGEVLRLWNVARRARDRQEPQFEEWLEALNDAIEDPKYTHLGQNRTHHFFTEDNLGKRDADPLLPFLT